MSETADIHELDQTPENASATNKKHRSWGTRAAAIAMLVGGAGMAFLVQTPAGLDLPIIGTIAEKKQSGDDPTALATHKDGRGGSSTSKKTDVVDPITAAFTKAKVGDCLAWNEFEKDTVADFQVVSCSQPHTYEVSGKLKLTSFESTPGEFGNDAKYPAEESLNRLRNSVCQNSLSEYLHGKYDTAGKIAATPILPSQKQWDSGDRTILCGGMSTDVNGATQPLQQPLADVDQARVFEARTCANINGNGALIPADCNSDHLMEATRYVDLKAEFAAPEQAAYLATDGVPTGQQQNDLLADRCTVAAQDYLGGDDALYNSTLVPFWTALSDNSYRSGSHSVNCWLIKDNGAGGFSTLRGHANESFTIDGAPPVAPPPRNPLRSQGAPADPGATQSGAANSGTGTTQ